MANVTYRSDFTLCGRVLLPGGILKHGAVAVQNGQIVYAGPAENAPVIGQLRQTEHIIAPGFVDIHCHGAGETPFWEAPRQVLEHHLAHGTTGMLATFYRDLGFERILRYTLEMKQHMGAGSNLLGVHLEGPYLNARYGAGLGGADPRIVPEEYTQLAETGVIRQWTYAPELWGSVEFVRYLVDKGIVPAIGHTEASPEQVYQAEKDGARIVTHLYDAMGRMNTRWCGTEETSTAEAALLCDNFYYEIICDSMGIHVRHDKILLAIKTVGLDRIVGITDCFMGPDDGKDVNFVDGILSGSKMTMDRVAKNFLSLGLSLPEVFQIVAQNPARAIGMADTVGSLTPGCRGDLLLIDEDLTLYEVIKAK